MTRTFEATDSLRKRKKHHAFDMMLSLFASDRRAHEVLWTSALRRPEWNVDSNLRGYGLTPQKKKAPCFCMMLFLFQSDRRGSNPRSRPWQGRALPTTPLSHLFVSLYLSDSFTIPYLNRNVNYFLKLFFCIFFSQEHMMYKRIVRWKK